jgi:hypothetical protein
MGRDRRGRDRQGYATVSACRALAMPFSAFAIRSIFFVDLSAFVLSQPRGFGHGSIGEQLSGASERRVEGVVGMLGPVMDDQPELWVFVHPSLLYEGID